jgi:hypothetical protein
MRNPIDLERRLVPLAVSVMLRNWVPCFGGATLLLLSNVGSGYVKVQIAFAVVRALIIMIVGYSIYRTLLSRGSVSGYRALANDEGRAPWRYAGVMLIILSPILVLGIVWTAPGGSVGPHGLNELILGLVMVILYAVIYVLLGTALPEIAERGDAALGDSISRGYANYRTIARSLVFGPWIFRSATVLVLILLSLAGVKVDLFAPDTNAFQPIALIPMMLFTTGHIFAEVLTAIVLVRAYRRYPVPRTGPAVA